MMKKEMTLPVSSLGCGCESSGRSSWLASFKAFCLGCAPVLFLSAFYSRLLEMRVTPRQTLHLLHAQCAFFVLLFPLPFSLWMRLLFLLWFVLSVRGCRRAGLR